ncbi:hypothetical protein MKK88_16245 [Methylobacterium sp. E-005]|uniref:hypothetical protein n=1 Tax=Methylobacterium sp. E-005 TaxID=2836549 RepID=UPI001FB9958F|nr:hypothetical protein [Methylobacterium sp. E-005]MCJ2087520.1 hypothetical protein [Methylobacterium sp. E-005]
MSNAHQHADLSPQGIEDVIVMRSRAPIDWADRLYAGEKPVRKEPMHPVDPDLAQAMRMTWRGQSGSAVTW